MAIESDSCYPFFVPPPFPPFTSTVDEKLLEDDYQPISDLELHFNTLFMLESEKGRNYHTKDDLSPKNTDITSHLTLLGDNTGKHKETLIESDNLRSNHFNDNKNNQIIDGGFCSDKNVQKSCNMSSRSESFTMSELSTCSYSTGNNNIHSSSSDYGSLKSNSLEESEWKYYSDVNFTRLDDKYNWIDEKCDNKEDDVFFDSNFTGRLTPDSISDEVLGILHTTPLPPLETAFSKQFGRFAERDASIPQNGSTCNNLDLYIATPQTKTLSIDNLDGYCYPNNILFPNEVNSKTDSDKNTDYSELFDKISYETIKKSNIFENEIKPIHTEEKLTFIDERKIANNLIEDLDSLSYYKQDEDNLIGFEDYCDQKESSFDIHDGGDILSTTPEDEGRDFEPHKDERICFWKGCEMHFPNQTILVEHIEKVHVNTYKGEEFSCLWCACARETRPFNARYKLLIHMRVHSGHKPNKCGFLGCGKAFSRLENLKIHRRSHTGERPYRCQAPRCSKAFSNSSDRAKHQRTHFNARPYACQIEGCIKRYTDPSSLRKHVKNHFSPTSRLTNKMILQQESRKNAKFTQEIPQKNIQPLINSKIVTIAVQQKIKMDRIASSTKNDTSSLKNLISLRSSKRLSNNDEETRRNENKRIKIGEDGSYNKTTIDQEERLNFLDISESTTQNTGLSDKNLSCLHNFHDSSNINNIGNWIEDRQERGGKSDIQDRFNSCSGIFDQVGTDFDQYMQEQFNIGYFEENFP